MSYTTFRGEFIEKAESLILDNLSNEQFGVSELAELMNMSRSNLLRKIKKQTELSASQFIRLVRLQKGMELLKETELTVSEISYQVGFGNNSYFIKCFREQFGYSPGEVRKQDLDETAAISELTTNEKVIPESNSKKHRLTILLSASVLLLVISFFFFRNPEDSPTKEKVIVQKSIAVLPFKNMSSDSTNLYFVNGLMESSLNNLQRIKDLRVISRTSVEKYRNTNRAASEIGKELNVSYLVEGSGQRIGDEVLLNIQLIDASNDTPIWTKQYKRKVVNVFSLQNEVSKKIANAIQAKITPAELVLIENKPTDNLLAYDYYLKAQDQFQIGNKEQLKQAIRLYEKAIEQDPEFSLAYSKIAIAYFYLDLHQEEKKYTQIINKNADKALLYNSKSDLSLIAKALYYINNNEFRYAIPHLEKALEYNPNSATVVNTLSDLYARAIPNTAKYLKYALKGVQIDVAANDSISKSFIYLHLSNAFIQNGFTKEALKYIDISIYSNPANEYAPYLKAFIEYAHKPNMSKITKQLTKEWKKDTTRLDIIQEVAKFHYFQKDYDSAYYYYSKFIKRKKKYGLNIYPQENLKIGIVYEKMGLKSQATDFYKAYSEYCENDTSIYQPASVASKYVYEGKLDLAIEQLKLFATKDNYQYWIVLFFEKDPLIDSLKHHPEYKATLELIKNKFWEDHNQIKKLLNDNGLLEPI